MNTTYPNHIGFIPDGNRRFAKEHGLSLEAAYRIGAEKALLAVDRCRSLGIKNTSFYGTSANNILKRPREEIIALQKGVVYFCLALKKKGVGVHLLGTPQHAVIPEYTLLFDENPSAGDGIVHIDAGGVNTVEDELRPLFIAMEQLGFRTVTASPAAFIRTAQVPPLDLIIRTGKRRRLSNFLPWQSSNAELYFLDLLWPEFEVVELERALVWFGEQERTQGS